MKIARIKSSVEGEYSYIEIIIGEKLFKISQNNFDELVINKQVYDDQDGCLMIKPSVSNEVRLI